MTDYKTLSIHNGHGDVHINRFRISAHPPRDRRQIAAIAESLFANMPNYMARNTASVVASNRVWNGRSTLKFRGVARLRPFSVPVKVPIAGIWIPVPVPKRVRDWMAPDIHTDSVGIVTQHGTGFTVQTLKREYEDDDDAKIRAAVTALVSAGTIALPPAIPAASVLARLLGDVAVYYNQHHFLAGRRSFRFDVGSSFGYRDDRVVFETVAIERFSSIVFAGSEVAMGSIPNMVRQVWGEMLTQFCALHGLTPIQEQPGNGWSRWGNAVHCMQTEVFPSVVAIESNAHYPTMRDEHQQILEPRP
jgi:hypothetical protein